MSDAICPRCGDDNLTDYPVCDTCATVAHFTHRATCLHCVRKHAAAIQENEMLELIERAGEIMIELASLADSFFASDAFVQKSQWHKDAAALRQKIEGGGK